MPITAPKLRVPRFPIWVAVLLPLGMFLAGHGFASLAARSVARTVVETSYGTRTTTETRFVERKVHGKVIHRDEKVYVQVPVVIVHTDHHTIRVPRHLLPIRSAAATVAYPLVTVRVAVPTTVFVPTVETVTVTSTATDIVPTTVTTTITLPFNPDS
jgi:hypothetical protein